MSPHVSTIDLSSSVRVAVVIECGRIMPRWFDLLDRPSSERVHIKEITYRWSHHEGTAKILHFAVYDGANVYQLSLNVRDFTWSVGIAVSDG